MPTFDHTSMEYSPEMAAFEAEQFEWGGETEWGETEVFNEMELMELAHELLAVTNEAKLYRFLGDLITREGQPIGGVVRSPIVQAVGGFLKGAAKRVLPLAGGAMGGYSGWPLLRGSWEACCQYRRKMPFILPIRQRTRCPFRKSCASIFGRQPRIEWGVGISCLAMSPLSSGVRRCPYLFAPRDFRSR
jgi:hypothetical protein